MLGIHEENNNITTPKEIPQEYISWFANGNTEQMFNLLKLMTSNFKKNEAFKKHL